MFSSFRATLGDELYELVQARDEREQGELLAAMLASPGAWEVYAAELAGEVVGFVAVRLDHESLVGEIGLNAVHPDHARRGIGAAMYDFVLARMKDAGMRAATVSTGGDASHAPARRAYAKAGFAAAIPSVWLCRKL